MRDKPAIGDGCSQHRCHGPGARPHDEAPEKVELPGLRHHRRQRDAGRDDAERDDDDPADAKAVHERSREGAEESEHQEIDGDAD